MMEHGPNVVFMRRRMELIGGLLRGAVSIGIVWRLSGYAVG